MTDTSLAHILSGKPLPSLPPVDDSELDKYHRDLNEYLQELMGLFTDNNLVASPDLRVVEENGFIETPGAKSYTLVEYVEYRSVIKRITHKTSSGSCTLAVDVDGVSLTGVGDNTPGTSQGVLTFDDDVVEVGSRIEITLSSLSSPLNLAFTLKRERALT